LSANFSNNGIISLQRWSFSYGGGFLVVGGSVGGFLVVGGSVGWGCGG